MTLFNHCVLQLDHKCMYSKRNPTQAITVVSNQNVQLKLFMQALSIAKRRRSSISLFALPNSQPNGIDVLSVFAVFDNTSSLTQRGRGKRIAETIDSLTAST